MRIRLGIAALLAAALALASVGLASAGSKASSDEGSAQTFTVFSLTVQLALIDLGDAGPSLGNQFVFSDDLYTKKGGDRIGYDGGVCTTVRREPASGKDTVQCAVTFSLEGGQIATQALLTLTNGHFSGTEVGPITGGSGRFKDASGEVAVEFFSDTEANITFRLGD